MCILSRHHVRIHRAGGGGAVLDDAQAHARGQLAEGERVVERELGRAVLRREQTSHKRGGDAKHVNVEDGARAAAAAVHLRVHARSAERLAINLG